MSNKLTTRENRTGKMAANWRPNETKSCAAHVEQSKTFAIS